MKKTVSLILTAIFIMQVFTSIFFINAAANSPSHSQIESEDKRPPLTLLDPTIDDNVNESTKLPENNESDSAKDHAEKIIDDLIAIAENEVGYTETNDNITKYGKFTGTDGNPWCGPFISWCASKAGLAGNGKLFTGWGTYAKPYSLLKDNTFEVWYFFTDNGSIRYAQTEVKKDLSWVTKPGMAYNATGKNDNGKNQGNSTGYAYLLDGKNGNVAVSKWKIAFSNDTICAIARPDYVSYAASQGYTSASKENNTINDQVEKISGKKTFTDVHKVNHPAKEAVDFVYEKGYMKGVSETEFAPDITMTRAMFVTVLHRMENEPSVSYSRKFKDVERGSYYEAAVEWGSKNGIIKGISEKEFAPHSDVTREQTAVLLYRWLKAKGDRTRTDKVYNIAEYVEAGLVSDYAKEAVEWMLERDIISEKDIASMKDPSTRGEAAQMIAGTVKALESAERFPF